MSYFWRGLGLVAFGFIAIAFDPSETRALDITSLSNPQSAQVTADSSGRLHAVWIDQSGTEASVFYQAIDPFGSRSVGTASRIYESRLDGSRLRRPRIVVGDEGEIHLILQERFAKVSGARATEGTWVHYIRFRSSEIPQGGSIRHTVLNERPKALHPDLAVDRRGNAAVVWEEESDALVLIRIGSNGLLSSRHLIPVRNSTEGRAFPALAADRRGNIHLAWTEPSGRADRMVYTVLDQKAFRPLITQRTLHTVPSALGQRKSLSVDPSGQVRLEWAAKKAEGPGSEIASDRHHLIIRAVSPASPAQSINPLMAGGVSDLVDRHFHAALKLSSPPADEGLPGKRLEISPPARVKGVHLSFSSSGPERMADGIEIEKVLMRHLLEFSSWTGAPPRREESSPSFPARPASTVGPRPILTDMPFSDVLTPVPNRFITMDLSDLSDSPMAQDYHA